MISIKPTIAEPPAHQLPISAVELPHSRKFNTCFSLDLFNATQVFFGRGKKGPEQIR